MTEQEKQKLNEKPLPLIAGMRMLKWLRDCGYYLTGYWTIQVYIKVPTKYFTDTAGEIHTT